MKGIEGTQQDYGMRIYDSRVGRFLSVDPITKEYPELTPYQFASNRPIDGIDLDGLEYAKYLNPKATALLIISTAEPTNDLGMKMLNEEGIRNPNINVVKVRNMTELSRYLEGSTIKYESVLFQGHGYARESTMPVGDYQYDLKSVKEDADHFRRLEKNMTTDGVVVILGCFSANPELGGNELVTEVSNLVNRKVYGNKAITYTAKSTAFTGNFLGDVVKERDKGRSWADRASRFAKSWSVAYPDGKIDNIGNVGIDYEGKPQTKLVPPMTPLAPKKSTTPTMKEILGL